MKRTVLLILVIGILLLTACRIPTTAPSIEAPPTEETTLPSETPSTPPPIERQTYTLSIGIFPSGAGVVSPPSGEYEPGTKVTLTATAATGYDFNYWGGDAALGSSATVTIVMNSNRSVIAHFTDVPSVISKLDISHVTESEAYIWWLAPEGHSQIEYGVSEAYGNTSIQSKDTTWHHHWLRGLEPETLYHFRILFVSKDGTEFLSNDYTFVTKNAKELVSAALYPVKTTSTRGRITHLGSTLFNDSSQAMTVYRMEILSHEFQIQYAISESGHYGEEATIAETWGRAVVEAGHSLSVSCQVYEPPLREEVADWQVKWYCLTATGEKLTVTAKYSSLY